jgi:presenilin 1
VHAGNLICIAATTAYIFCRLPEWTTLVLLIFMAVYDLGAVLLPMGPLRVSCWVWPETPKPYTSGLKP